MDAKTKAAYLVVKYMSKVVSKRVAIECALVAVDELLNDTKDVVDYHNYWQQVKQELEKL
jgi:hypothetical protein